MTGIEHPLVVCKAVAVDRYSTSASAFSLRSLRIPASLGIATILLRNPVSMRLGRVSALALGSRQILEDCGSVQSC